MNTNQASFDRAPTQATPEDAAEALRLLRACVEMGCGCWNDDYPNAEVVAEDIAQKALYLWRDQVEVIGAVSLLAFDDVEEQGLPFRFTDKPCVLCRLCVAPSLQGRGYGRAALFAAEKLAAELGYQAVHLMCDTHNEVAQKLYCNADYAALGEVALYGLVFTVFEKPIAARSKSPESPTFDYYA